MSLQKAGFSRKDFREIEKVIPQQQHPVTRGNLFENMELNDIETEDNPMDMTDEEVESIKAELHVPGTNTEIATLQEQAKQLSKEYDKQIDDNSNYNDP